MSFVILWLLTLLSQYARLVSSVPCYAVIWHNLSEWSGWFVKIERFIPSAIASMIPLYPESVSIQIHQRVASSDGRGGAQYLVTRSDIATNTRHFLLCDLYKGRFTLHHNQSMKSTALSARSIVGEYFDAEFFPDIDTIGHGFEFYEQARALKQLVFELCASRAVICNLSEAVVKVDATLRSKVSKELKAFLKAIELSNETLLSTPAVSQTGIWLLNISHWTQRS